jgi:hypothetical protein
LEEHLSYSFTNNIIYLDRGKLITFYGEDEYRKAHIRYDYNCYWDARKQPLEFYGKSFDEWKKLGRDAHSIVADPLFADPSRYDFCIRNRQAIRKIKFKPFDYSLAGVYGGDEWKAKAAMPEELEKRFDETIKQLSEKK